MKHHIQNFPAFLNERFQPCVLCSYSYNAELQDPNIMQHIQDSWDKLMKELKLSVRLIFPKVRIDINVATSELFNFRNFGPKTKPYFFLENPPKTEYKTELPTMTILRQRLFESNFMPFHCFCDMPIAILLFYVKNENTPFSISHFPEWIQPYISSIKPDVIRVPVSDYYEFIKRFYTSRFLPKLNQRVEKIEKDYLNVKNQTFLISIRSIPSKSMISMKYFADLKMQQNQYKKAIQIYSKLFDTPLGQQSKIMSVLCNIAQGIRNSGDLILLDDAIPENNIIEQFALKMVKFFISKTIPIMKSILPYGQTFIILNPFLFEQYAYLCSKRKRSYLLFYASLGFHKIENNELEVKCLYNSWGIVNSHNFNLISQKLMKNAVKSYDGDDPVKIFSIPITCKEIVYPKIFQEKISSITVKRPIPCGFVDARVVKLKSNGFPCAPPEGFSGYWPKTAQQLFGAFDHKRFFKYNIFDIVECATNEVITIKIFFNNRCDFFRFTNLRLKINSDIPVETFPELPDGHLLDINFMVKSEGTIEVCGIEFEWENIKFEKIFPSLPIKFTVFDQCPRIDLQVEGGKKDIFIGEIVPITIHIKNGNMKLKYLAMKVISNANYNVLYPLTEELLGQRFLKALEPEEEFTVRLSICGTFAGTCKLLLIFPFWSFQPPCRYNYHFFEFNVTKAPEIPLFSQDEYVVGQCPNDFTAFGFTSPYFDASKYITKLKERKCHMSLISFHNQNSPQKYKYELPDYCLPFIQDINKILFWYKSPKSMVFSVLEESPSIIASIEDKENDFYQMTIKNICNKKINDVKVLFVEKQEEISYLFSGPNIKYIGSLEPNQSYQYRFFLKLLYDEALPIIMISGDFFSITHPLVLTK